MALLTRTPYTDESHLELIRRLSRGRPSIPYDDPNDFPAAGNMAPVSPPDADVMPQELLTRSAMPSLGPEFSNPERRMVEVGPAPPMVRMDKSGRPTRQGIIGDGDVLEREQAYGQAIQDYQPQKESKKKIALRTALGFLFGGIPGAVGTLGGELLDRRQHDRAWQQRELAGSGRVLDQIGDQRRGVLQENLMRSQISENEAQAMRARREPTAPGLVDYGGYQIPQTEAARLAQARQLAANKPKVERGVLQREVKHRDGGTHWEQSYDNGRTWEKSTGSGDDAPPEKPDDSGFTNSQLEAAINEAQSERDLIDARLKTTPKTVPTNFVGVNAPNPEYHQLEERSRKLHSDILDWKTKMKAPTLTRGQSKVVKPASDGKYHYTRAQIQAHADAQGMTYDEVETRLKKNPKAVID